MFSRKQTGMQDINASAPRPTPPIDHRPAEVTVSDEGVTSLAVHPRSWDAETAVDALRALPPPETEEGKLAVTATMAALRGRVPYNPAVHGPNVPDSERQSLLRVEEGPVVITGHELEFVRAGLLEVVTRYREPLDDGRRGQAQILSSRIERQETEQQEALAHRKAEQQEDQARQQALVAERELERTGTVAPGVLPPLPPEQPLPPVQGLPMPQA